MENVRKNKLSTIFNGFCLFLMCCVMLGLTSCKDKGTKELESIVEEVNKKCPIKVSDECFIDKVTLEDKMLTYYFSYPENAFRLPEDFEENGKEELADQLLTIVCNFDGQEKKMVDLLLEKDFGLKFVLDFKRTKKQITYKFSADRIRKARANSGTTSSKETETIAAPEENEADAAVEAIKADIEVAKQNVPTDLGGGITQTDVYFSNNCIYYIYSCDESQLPLEQWNSEVISSVKQAIIQEITGSSDANLTNLVSLCKKANVGFVYRYTGADSGIERDVRITADEL